MRLLSALLLPALVLVPWGARGWCRVRMINGWTLAESALDRALRGPRVGPWWSSEALFGVLDLVCAGLVWLSVLGALAPARWAGRRRLAQFHVVACGAMGTMHLSCYSWEGTPDLAILTARYLPLWLALTTAWQLEQRASWRSVLASARATWIALLLVACVFPWFLIGAWRNGSVALLIPALVAIALAYTSLSAYRSASARARASLSQSLARVASDERAAYRPACDPRAPQRTQA